MVFVVRGELLRALKADAEWWEKAKRCGSVAELQRVFEEFAEAKGYAVGEVGVAA